MSPLESCQRIGAEPEPEGFQSDDASAGMFPRFTSGPSLVTKYACSGWRGLEQQAVLAHPGGEHVLDQPEPQRAVRPADAGPPALPGLQRDQRRPRREVLRDVLVPGRGGSCWDRPGSLKPTSDTTVKSSASLRM